METRMLKILIHEEQSTYSILTLLCPTNNKQISSLYYFNNQTIHSKQQKHANAECRMLSDCCMCAKSVCKKCIVPNYCQYVFCGPNFNFINNYKETSYKYQMYIKKIYCVILFHTYVLKYVLINNAIQVSKNISTTRAGQCLIRVHVKYIYSELLFDCSKQ